MDKKLMALLATAELTASQLSWLTGEQISWLTASQLSWLTASQIRGLTGEQISWLTGEQLRGLTASQLSWLTASQLSWLTASQIRGLTGEQLSWLTASQLSWLTGEQLRGLTGEGVPAVENLYGKMLGDIQAEKRRIDQSLFGPESDPGENLCDTPMCIAGHTVNLAGEAGYVLAKKHGFAVAAFLIHRKSLPDTPAPRYDNYPNGWALAYIEARAEEAEGSAEHA